MKLGNKINLILILFFFPLNFLISEDKITTAPLINMEQIAPSFEALEEEYENISSDEKLKEKKKNHFFKISSSNFNWSR